MNCFLRFSMATVAVGVFCAGFYGCSSDSGDGIPGPASGTGGDAATLAAADGSTPGETPRDGGGSPNDAGQPKTCPYLETAGNAGPVFEPAACRTCVAERCCARITKCYGAAPAEASLDGGDGKKTACVLFGECGAACEEMPTPAEQADCEEACETYYGATPTADWESVDTCINSPGPSGCQEFCP